MDWMNWRTWAVIGLIIIGVFAIYTFAATQSAHLSDDTVRGARPAIAKGPAPAPGVGVIHTEWLAPQSGSYQSERNLFAYKEPPPPPPPRVQPQPIIQPPPQPVAPPPPPQPVEPPKPVPPQFTYHYIGTFGPAGSPIATFSGDGKIVNVRAGDTIDGKFILRNIGIESVEIGYVGFPPETKTRVAIGQ